MPSFFSLYLAKTQSEVEKGREKFTEQLRNVNDALKESSPEGPFFLGELLGAVDANLIPFAIRLFILESLREYKGEAPSQLVRADFQTRKSISAPCYAEVSCVL